MNELTQLKAMAWDRLMSSRQPVTDHALMDAWRWYTHVSGLPLEAQQRVMGEDGLLAADREDS